MRILRIVSELLPGARAHPLPLTGGRRCAEKEFAMPDTPARKKRPEPVDREGEPSTDKGGDTPTPTSSATDRQPSGIDMEAESAAGEEDPGAPVEERRRRDKRPPPGALSSRAHAVTRTTLERPHPLLRARPRRQARRPLPPWQP